MKVLVIRAVGVYNAGTTRFDVIAQLHQEIAHMALDRILMLANTSTPQSPSPPPARQKALQISLGGNAIVLVIACLSRSDTIKVSALKRA